MCIIDIQLVYTDKAKCLEFLKKVPGGRFKVFSAFEEAKKFAELSQPTPTKEDQPQVGEKATPFRSLKSQELVQFRKAIEKGNLDFFEEVYTV